MNFFIIKIFLGAIFHFFLNFFFKKINLFKDNLSSSNHKKLAVENKKTLLTGGFSFLILLLLFFEENKMNKGLYSYTWNGENFSSGLYFMTIQAQIDDYLPIIFSRKMIYLK